MRLHSDLWASPVAIAHRGSRLLWPENTIAAFAGAVDMGFSHLETDLHATSDGKLVCFHDETVDRTTDGAGPVSSMTLAEIQELDAGYRHATTDGYRFRGQGLRVPTFEEAVLSFPDARFVVDLKADGLEELLAEVVERLSLHDRLIVGSFSDLRLARFRELSGGRVATSTGRTLSRLWVLASRAGRGGGGDASALQLPTHVRGVRVVDRKLVDAAHDAGLHVHVWTVNRKEQMSDLLDIGVDGLVTDRPDLLKEVLVERGDWNGR
jgi:glycerophosphoryl diester phosphodiesterase